MPPDREQDEVGGDARPVRQTAREFLAVLVDLGDRAAGDDRDAFLLHLGAHMGTDVLVKTAQDIVAAIDDGHVGAEARENAGKLQRDIPTALNDYTFGKFR